MGKTVSRSLGEVPLERFKGEVIPPSFSYVIGEPHHVQANHTTKQPPQLLRTYDNPYILAMQYIDRQKKNQRAVRLII